MRRSSAGLSSKQYYRQSRRRFHREIRRPLVFVATPLLLATALIRLYFPWNPNFWAGLWLGAVLAMTVSVWDELPEAVQNWRLGFIGERLTHKALGAASLGYIRPDVTLGYGNIDHIVVSDRGVFVVDSKYPRGKVTIAATGVLVHRPISPRNDWRLDTNTGNGARLTAVRLRDYIKGQLGWAPYVQAVVVVWGEVSGAPQKIDRVMYVGGNKLTTLMLEGQANLSLASQREIANVVASLADADADAGLKTIPALT